MITSIRRIFTPGLAIARRYMVVNGFDGGLTMLGIMVGFYFGGTDTVAPVISACLGAAVALGISGFSSAYISETAERKKELADLEHAMIRDMGESQHEQQMRRVPLFVALVNGASPFLLSMLILSPLFLEGATLSVQNALLASMLVGFISLFFLGIFVGRLSNTFWLWSGVRTLAIALFTTAIIFLVTKYLH
ncbi:MAG: VIT1/CCC1 transporter family protein [Gammaproteobacteria bacterium]|nr:VIT1/CCC1 transporter family protein [Gammaproteobacteria bacterium]